MYFYNIYGWAENLILYHEEKFTKEEFIQMCKEAPRFICEIKGKTFSSYDSVLISEYLINKYGFKKIEYTESFFMNRSNMEV